MDEMYGMPDERRELTEAQLKNQSNAANNANNIRVAADVASKTNNPYAKAIGTGVKIADKLSGGKASENLGKSLNTALKTQGLKGKMMQAALNKMGENGTSNRIGSALNKKNGSGLAAARLGGKSDAKAEGKDNSFFSKKEVEEQTSDGGGVSFKSTVKVLKIGLAAFAPVMIVLIFMNLIVAGSQTYLKVIGLEQADQVSLEKADEAIRKNGSEGLDDEITDENVDEGLAGDLTAYIEYKDIFIEDAEYTQDISSIKLNKHNFINNTKNREYSESDLTELEDYYSLVSYKNGEYDMDIVYKFFFKLFYIQKHYENTYDVKLDMPLLMAVLSMQSEDMNIVFNSNIEGYKISTKQDNPLFVYDYDWSNYTLSENSSAHDIEILAKNMVSVRTNTDEEACKNTVKDGKCYELVSTEEYKEFLRGFLEKKYFISSDTDLNDSNNENNPDVNDSNDENNISTCSLIVQGDKYYKIVNPQTESCYVSGFYDDNSWGLEPTFYKNVLALINDAKSVGCDAAIISGHRTYAKQAYLYNCYITGKCNNGNMAAKPGYSNHEYGIAADLSYYPYTNDCLNYYHTNAYKYGLDFPLLYASFPENWHIEPINIIKGTP